MDSINIPRVRVLSSLAEKVRQLDLGKNLFVPGWTVKRACVATNRAAKMLGHKYKVRTEEGGVRIYRVA